MFDLFENRQHEKHQQRSHECDQVKATPYSHAYRGDNPYAGGGGQTADRAFHLDYCAGAKETDT